MLIETLALTFPNFDPVALHLGPIVIRWYALAYITGILLGWWLIGKLNNRYIPPALPKKAYDDMVVWAVLGVILGGRIGYVLFYKPSYFAQHPAEILQLWHGGMSFHGGMLGVIISFWLFSKHFKIPYWQVMDLLAVVTPIGLFFGRLANFINGELFGRVTDSPLGMIFPTGGPYPRHPSQLYEAGLEGLVLFAILWTFASIPKFRNATGFISGMFLTGYGVARFTVEFFREPDAYLGFIIDFLTMGQLLCLPMILCGCGLMIWALRRKPAPISA